MDRNVQPAVATTAPTGRLSIAPTTGRWSWSDATFALHGMEPGAVVPTAALFLRHVHPDDRPLVEQVVDAGRREPAGCEYRVVDLAGKVRTVTLAVDSLPDGTVIGLLVDVTSARSRAIADGVNAQLAVALESRSVIDQAKGIVMATCGVESEMAFACLSYISQHRNIRLRALAEEVRTAASANAGIDGLLLDQIRATLAVLAARETREAREAREADPEPPEHGEPRASDQDTGLPPVTPRTVPETYDAVELAARKTTAAATSAG